MERMQFQRSREKARESRRMRQNPEIAEESRQDARRSARGKLESSWRYGASKGDPKSLLWALKAAESHEVGGFAAKLKETIQQNPTLFRKPTNAKVALQFMSQAHAERPEARKVLNEAAQAIPHPMANRFAELVKKARERIAIERKRRDWIPNSGVEFDPNKPISLEHLKGLFG